MTDLKAVPDPTELGFDPGRLAAIDAYVATNYLDNGRFPGMSLVVARGSKIAHVSHQAYADDAIFRIYSMSKPVTSIALMQLYEQGKIKLSDPVSDYLPSWANLRVWRDGSAANFSTDFPEREMIVRDLLTHTAGLTYGWMGRHPVDAIYRKANVDGGGSPSTLAGMCEALADVPLLFSPGTEWSYSVATDVCGHLVELVSGQPLDEYFQQHIFEPLGMVDTGFFVDDDRGDRLTANYAHPDLSPFGVPPDATGQMALIDDGSTKSQYRSKPTFFSGGGGLTSTLADYHRFTQMLINGGALDGNRVIGRKTLQYAASNHLPNGVDLAAMGQAVFSETTYEGIGFGLGFSVMLRPADAQVIGSPGEFAWGGAASTMFWVDPVEDLTVVAMTQLMPSSAYPIRQELKALVYGALT